MTRSNVQNSAIREFGPSRNISSARCGGATTAATVESGAGWIGASLAISSQRPLDSTSIFPPHMTGENVKLAAVLGDGASRNGNAALAQNLNDLVIAQRRTTAFMLHEIENGLFYACVAQRFAGRRLIATCEKVFHFEYALGRGHVFAGHRAANRGLMHADSVGDFCHR